MDSDMVGCRKNFIRQDKVVLNAVLVAVRTRGCFRGAVVLKILGIVLFYQTGYVFLADQLMSCWYSM